MRARRSTYAQLCCRPIGLVHVCRGVSCRQCGYRCQAMRLLPGTGAGITIQLPVDSKAFACCDLPDLFSDDDGTQRHGAPAVPTVWRINHVVAPSQPGKAKAAMLAPSVSVTAVPR